MEIIEKIERLEKVYAENDCECINEPPYTKCRACQAAHILNEIDELLKESEPLMESE